MMKRRLMLFALAAGAAALVAPGISSAADKRVAELQAIAETGGRSRRLAAIDELVRKDSSESRGALEALAASRDAELASLALLAIGRADYSGARTKLADAAGDAKRSDAARAAALTAWLRAEEKDGKSWDAVNGTAESKAGSNDLLKDVLSAVKKARFDAKGGQ
ncbi:MAG: hypothetical protein HMLKMBBP_02131 [Planctomycetes bacterium]|nr:hypothetical protein [Planctomycetota bacterium]